MKDESPILFRPEMSAAKLKGIKSQTRRMIKPQPGIATGIGEVWKGWDDEREWIKNSPYGNIGDTIWTRENVWLRPGNLSLRDLKQGADTWPEYIYDADNPDVEWLKEKRWTHKPSIFMPKTACRQRDIITNIRAEILDTITDEDCFAEGIRILEGSYLFGKKGGKLDLEFIEVHPRLVYFTYLSTITKEPYEKMKDKWVWVIEFKKAQP